MKVYDCTIINDELELLEARFREGDGIVDHWVVVEANETHTGTPKPLYFQENQDRFAKWESRIIHIIVDLSSGTDPWQRERMQRDGISQGIQDASPDDIIAVTDADELIAATSWQEIERLTEFGPVLLPMQQFYYSLCWATPWWGERGRVARKRNVGIVSSFADYKCFNSRLYNAGWHLSCLGGAERVAQKLKAFAHTELSDSNWANKENCEVLIKNGWDINPERGWQLEKVAPQGPKWLLEEGVKIWPWLLTGENKKTLNEIFCDRNTDKGTYHNYGPDYEKFIDPESISNLLEIGVWTGSSMLAWHDWLPKAEIWGVDIIAEPEIIKPFDRLHYIMGNINNPQLGSKLPCQFDIIIDDGSHITLDIKGALELLWPRLVYGGWYIIEDIFVNPGIEDILIDMVKPSEHHFISHHSEILFMKK